MLEVDFIQLELLRVLRSSSSDVLDICHPVVDPTEYTKHRFPFLRHVESVIAENRQETHRAPTSNPSLQNTLGKRALVSTFGDLVNHYRLAKRRQDLVIDHNLDLVWTLIFSSTTKEPLTREVTTTLWMVTIDLATLGNLTL